MNGRVTHECKTRECEDTRDRILLAAQKLFAERGFDATSVRDITTEAECNVASVNYHFGGKDKLYLETFRSMLQELRRQRLSVLDELIQRTPAPTLEEFLRSFAEGFIDPLVDAGRGRHFMALVSREMFDPRLPRDVFLSEFIHPILEKSLVALEASGPRLEATDARLCIMAMVGQLLHALRAHHLFASRDRSHVIPTGPAEYIPHFVRFAAGGIHACARVPAEASDESITSEVGP
jgi:AcrR family transcriptional regulator